MGCSNCDNRGRSGGSVKGDNCVTDVIRGIIHAQRRAAEAEEDTCVTGCDRSIEELLSPFEENRDRPRHNTIPFILFTKEGKPFTGVGVRQDHDHRSDRSFFECIESPIFRAKSFVDRDENCVRLELLTPVRDRRDGPAQHTESDRHGKHGHCRDEHDFCDFLPRHTRNFRATGICITVDLDCFCGISCLDPITPLRARA